MPDSRASAINIAIVGGGTDCTEILERSTIGNFDAEVIAVADPDRGAPGMQLAEKLGIATVTDFRELYRPSYNIQLIAVLTPEQKILDEILKTKPDHIRALSYKAFSLFQSSIRLEESRMKKRNREIETILNGIEDFILVLGKDRTIIEVNDSFLREMGYTKEEIVGKRCHEVFQKADKRCRGDNHFCPLTEVITNRECTRKVIKRKDKHGDPHFVEVSIFPIWDEGGDIVKFIEVSRDITARKREEEAAKQRLEEMVAERTKKLEETHKMLLHKDKMASLGQLAASVVHEINNPIAGVLNLTMLIKRILGEETPGEKELAQFGGYVELMESEVRRISRIVSDLHAFARPTKGEPVPLDLAALMEKTFFLSANLLKINGVKVAMEMDSELPHIIGSEDQLQQVFMTLMTNAAEAVSEKGGGELSIGGTTLPEGDAVRITFTDDGVGIPEEHMDRLFEPFFTTKKEGKGMGLGLSVAYGIIKEYGGEIQVASKVGTGTTFRIDLPLKQLVKI